jgi:hypothetical protein
MNAFQKPTLLKAALKIALYGPAGSGKTFSSLLLSEGLARRKGRRVAVCDTEMGTSFYAQPVPQRTAHPEAFDFDVLHTKSVTEVLAALRSLDPDVHGVVVVDSVSHLWDACRNAYNGKLTRHGGIPLHAWGMIKKPYKDLMNLLLSLPVHVILCGRQGIDYGEDEGSGELKQLGFKLRAEGETAYEPDVLVRMESHKANRRQAATILAHVEKDRTGILAGSTIEWPKFENLAQPLLGLLGSRHAALPTDEEVGQKDAEALAYQEEEQVRQSAELASGFAERISEAGAVESLRRVASELTAAVKARLTPRDLEQVRRLYGARLATLKKEVAAAANGTA